MSERSGRSGIGRDLAGTAALVTGASSGIGEATARALAARGAAVALVARRAERLERLAGEIEKAGGRAVALAADVTDGGAAADVVARAVDRFGRLDTVVANAGVMLLGPVEHAEVSDWEQMVSLNVMGCLYVARAALGELLRAARQSADKVADLVLVSSIAGRRADAGSAVYNLTKHGVGAFAEALRQEVTQRHVRVSVVEPGPVTTELTSHLSPELRARADERWRDVTVLEADDIADAIEYIVTRPRHVAVNELVVRPSESVF
ncbi:SDR family NAD(P)-dependent oxidoreductase [Streptomyces sp. NBC_00005]|uniref:SDR family NAD(P)-dependent oxidoreductase n=1 Tax=Streptomyces sp. NBC_00005 TaxID=2903609 RepID=UPI003246054E